MKKMTAAAVLMLALSLTACGSSTEDTTAAETTTTTEEATEESTKRVASDDAKMQTEDPTIATRIPPEDGTKINIRFGDEAVITGVLNDSETAQALIDKLPYTVHMSRYSHDFCGVTEELPYNEDEVHYG